MDERLETVIEIVSKIFNVDKVELKGKCRERRLVEPRHIAIKLLMDAYGIRQYHIGTLMYGNDGKQHHKTVAHAINNACNMIDQFPEIRDKYHRCYSIIAGSFVASKLNLLYSEKMELTRRLTKVNFDIEKFEGKLNDNPALITS